MLQLLKTVGTYVCMLYFLFSANLYHNTSGLAFTAITETLSLHIYRYIHIYIFTYICTKIYNISQCNWTHYSIFIWQHIRFQAFTAKFINAHKTILQYKCQHISALPALLLFPVITVLMNFRSALKRCFAQKFDQRNYLHAYYYCRCYEEPHWSYCNSIESTAPLLHRRMCKYFVFSAKQ